MVKWIESYFSEFWHLMLEMAPWLLLGFAFAGILHVFMPKGSIVKYMGKGNLKSSFYGALLGVPLPLCSCGVIPTGISFHKEGASKGATVSFLISTPQTGVDSILATYSMLGLPFAILRPVVAFISGIFGGALTNLTGKNDITASCENHTPAEEVKTEGNKIVKLLSYAYFDFLMDIADWLVIGLGLAALIALILPDNFFTLYLDNQFLSMLIVLIASIPLYVCATGSIPIASVLMMKGLSPGAALVFLMAGPATNIATMTVIGKAIDKKTLVVYLTTIILSALFFGWLTNQFLPAHWFSMGLHQHGAHQHQLLPDWLQTGSAILLILLLISGYLRKWIPAKKTNHQFMSQFTQNLSIVVGGMTCNHCKMNIEKNLRSLKGVEMVIADPDSGEVVISGNDIDLNQISRKIEDIGYDFKGLKK